MTIRKLSRKKGHRERMFRNLATSLVLFEKVRTTEAKAKAVLPMIERLITHARTNTLAGRRYAKALLFDQNATEKLMEDVVTRQGTRTSGFIRITKLPPRPGDGAAMAQLELLLTPVEAIVEAATQTKVKVRAAAKKTAEQSEE